MDKSEKLKGHKVPIPLLNLSSMFSIHVWSDSHWTKVETAEEWLRSWEQGL